MNKPIVKNNLAALRNKAGLTTQQLADCIGYSESSVCLLERSDEIPSLETAYIIAAVLDLPVTEIWTPQVEVVDETITFRRVRRRR